MTPSVRITAWDPLAAIAAVLALVLAGAYVGVIASQDGQIAAWFLVGLVLAGCAAAYGAVRAARWRVATLAGGGLVLVVLGVLSLASLGLPVLVAGVLALVAAVRGWQP